MCDILLKWRRKVKKVYVLKREAWKLKDQSGREVFHDNMRRLEKISNDVEGNILSCCDSFKTGMLRTDLAKPNEKWMDNSSFSTQQ